MLTKKSVHADRKLKLSMQTLQRLDVEHDAEISPRACTTEKNPRGCTDNSCIGQSTTNNIWQIDNPRDGRNPG
jgi:hypothetical protein